ncbi:DUF3455 domain-containing protein [Paraburkholderia sp. B3]|uniref:DUF3455 domain-containing protein n=1 Tax=Paraburkholderia sp. B3 TaxID=3134791 RepID=UPI0039823C38
MKRLPFYVYAAPLAFVLGVGSLGGCATSAHTPALTNATLPGELRTDPDQTLDQVLVTRGDETWRCERDDTDAPGSATATGGGLRWTQEGSAGTLVDRARQNVGTVLPGGYFVAYDGSFVKVQVERQSQVDANTLTWARYDARRDGSSPGSGRFARISSIERIDTVGGLPPEPYCRHEGLRLLVPYSATYLLYRTSSAGERLASPDATESAAAAAGAVQAAAK